MQNKMKYYKPKKVIQYHAKFEIDTHKVFFARFLCFLW